ncbi:acyltransferase family protein [Spirillospora sp. CA-294931]|uniref:acyltransferase family protein n=1 Tax=Spirillospora sp. CA-294931 TaxID=3240042 RepID=UPI003D90F8BD
MVSPSAVPAPVQPATRLAWLDALRGIAALLVALHHASYLYLPSVQTGLTGRFDPGWYGVLVFFLVSGYIVPASLERHGSVRRFWIGRFFRIYPLLAVACAIAVLPVVLGAGRLRAGLDEYDTATALAAHLTMLQDVLAVPNAMNVLWTLSYEMVFYLLVVALFVAGAHRRSAGVAAGLAATALLAGGLLPTALLSRALGADLVVALAAALLVAAIAAAVSDRPALRAAGGLLGGLLALALVVVNGRMSPGEGLVILAVMFTGTAVYRAEHGQVSRPVTALAAVAVLAASVAAGAQDGLRAWLFWSVPMVLAAATFAVAWTLRARSVPRWLAGLGTVSFSVYLLHPLLLMASNLFFGTSGQDEAFALGAFVVALLAVSWAAHRWIEAPAQRFGKRLGRRPVPPAEPARVSVPVP